MENSTVPARSIKQVDNYSFKIEWTDGVEGVFLLSYLQKNCPCASCKIEKRNLNEEVRAFRIVSVGAYALKVEFTSGCSKGIFSFTFLKQMLNGGAL